MENTSLIPSRVSLTLVYHSSTFKHSNDLTNHFSSHLIASLEEVRIFSRRFKQTFHQVFSQGGGDLKLEIWSEMDWINDSK